MASSPGRTFFDGHVALIGEGKIDEMVDHDYTEDAVLITFFDGLDTPPPIEIRGRAALKKFFHEYMEAVGFISNIRMQFAEDYDGNEGGICFQATFDSKLGPLTVADSWHMRGGQIAVHHGFFLPTKK